jgi:hypothetical protein
MKTAFTALFALLCTVSSAAEPSLSGHSLQLVKAGRTLIVDNFTQQERAARRLTRGEWKIAGEIGSCTQDEELFKKYKDHGPAIWYDQEFQDAIVHFEFQPSDDCQQFVFTINGKGGHVFRFVTNEMATDVRAWDANHQGKRLVADGPRLAKGKWIPVTVELSGPKASVQIGESYKVAVEDPSYAVSKNVVGVSFHHGTLKLRNFQVLEAAPK